MYDTDPAQRQSLMTAPTATVDDLQIDQIRDQIDGSWFVVICGLTYYGTTKHCPTPNPSNLSPTDVGATRNSTLDGVQSHTSSDEISRRSWRKNDEPLRALQHEPKGMYIVRDIQGFPFRGYG